LLVRSERFRYRYAPSFNSALANRNGKRERESPGLIDNSLKHRDAQLSFFKPILIVFRSLSDPPGAMDLE